METKFKIQKNTTEKCWFPKENHFWILREVLEDVEVETTQAGCSGINDRCEGITCESIIASTTFMFRWLW